MRSINILLATFLLASFVFSQNEENSGPYKLPKYFGQAHDTYISDDAIILNYSPYVPVTNLSLIKYGLYRYSPLKSSGELIEKRIPTNEGIIRECYYSGDTITEFVVYYKKGFPKYQYSYAIRRRSCKTMEVLGEKKLTEYQYHDIEDHEYAHLLYNGNEFAFVEMTKTTGTITFLANDFEEINKVQLTEQVLSAIETKLLYLPKLGMDGSILLVFPTWSTHSLIPLTEVKNTVLHVTSENEIHSFTTHFTDSDIYQISNFSGNYEFDSKKEEIIWSYATASNTNMQQSGFGFARWDLQGNLLSNTHTVLDFETIFENEPEIQDWFKSSKTSPEEVWARSGRFGYFSYLKSEDGTIYSTITALNKFNPELGSGSYVIKTDGSGNILWIKPFFTALKTPHFYSGIPYLKDGKIHVLVGDRDVTKNAGITFSDISLDPKDGSEKNNNELNVVLEADEQLNFIFTNKKRDKISLEIRKGKTVSYKTINLK